MSQNKAYTEMQNIIKSGETPMRLLRIAAHLRSQELEKDLQRICKNRIVDGLFKGVISPEKAYSSVMCPKLLGTYEAEIAAELMALLQKTRCFLDIGCAEGYYTTGVAVKSDVDQVIGVDIDPAALAAATQSAAANAVDHKCTFFADLDQAMAAVIADPLIMIDVDGDELAVLDQVCHGVEKRQFQKVTLIIETDFGANGAPNTDLIVAALKANQFTIDKIVEQDVARRFSKLSKSLTHSFLDQVLLGMEGRPNNQCWIIASLEGRS